MNILQVNTADDRGGAEKISRDLHRAYRALGHRSWLIVRSKFSDDPDVLSMPNDRYRTTRARFWIDVGDCLNSLVGKVRGAGRLRELIQRIGEPARFRDVLAGREDFSYPATAHLLELTPQPPEIVHCHNLHAEMFDLRELPELSQKVPVVLTLHDAWLLSGHCAHSFDCERWKTGCGECPDLTIPPAVWRDATAFNWQRKRQIYSQSRLFISTPSRWLMQKVEQSILAPAIAEARVIANGVDLTVFRPGDKTAVRSSLGLPQDARILLFISKRPRRSIWKDYPTLQTAFAQAGQRLTQQPLILIVLGEQAPTQRIGKSELRFVGYQSATKTVAAYYQAADIYIHAARADTFPITVLEALACGVPVVATAVGGIPEQVLDLDKTKSNTATGILTRPQDPPAMAAAIERLLDAPDLLHRLSQNAAADARRRFDRERQVDEYLTWYGEIVSSRQHGPCTINR
jgi:glycosyltransferase involved in cell wall biosynthesis